MFNHNQQVEVFAGPRLWRWADVALPEKPSVANPFREHSNRFW